jgi:hypothetical protein
MSYLEIISQIEQLPLSERQLLLELLTRSVQQAEQTELESPKEVSLVDLIPGAYYLSDADADEIILSVVTPEELADLNKAPFDLAELPVLPKTLAQYVIEDREDRI